MNPYYAKNKGVMTVSSFKALDRCQQGALAEMAGLYTPEQADHFLIGSYVDIGLLTPSAFPDFVAHNADQILLKSGPNKGKPNAKFKMADKMMEKARTSPDFMAAIDGDHQVQIEFYVDGVPVRCTLDAVDAENGILTDLKTVRSFEWSWDQDRKMRLPFYETYGYWLQVSVYREAYRSVHGAYPQLLNLACIEKHDHPTLRLIVFSEENDAHRYRMDHEWKYFRSRLPDYWRMKQSADGGEINAENINTFTRCESCDWCRITSKLKIEEAESILGGNEIRGI